MTTRSIDSNADCIALAVAFFRAPSQFAELLYGRGRLPRGVPELLGVAAGNAQADGESPLSPFARSDELQQAALFFIEQVLLTHNANHYRVLGVEPDASLTEIKNNHRLLMRLFHPDRQNVRVEETGAIATRINQAYTVLRASETRAAYDFSLQQKMAAVRQTPAWPAPRRPPPSSRPAFTLPDFVVRHTAPVILGGVAAVATLGVALVYFNREPANVTATGHSVYRSAPELAHLPTPRPPAPATPAMPVPSVLAAEPLPAEPAPQYLLPAAAAQSAAPLPEPAPAPAPVAEAMEQAVPTAPQIRQALPVNDRKPAGSEPARYTGPIQPPAVVATPPVHPPTPPKPPAVAAAEPARSPPAKPREIIATVTVNPPEAPETKPPQPRPEQLSSLVASFSEHFQRGDLEKLLALFDGAARMDQGSDKAQIRNEYGDLFRNSESRTLYIWDMTWTPRGKTVRGNGHFQSRVIGKDDRAPRIYGGDITIDILQQDGNPLIVGLYRKTN